MHGTHADGEVAPDATSTRLEHAARSLQQAGEHLRAGELGPAMRELALGVHGLLAERRTMRAEAVLRRLHALPPEDGNLEQRLGRACFDASLYDAGAHQLIRAAAAFRSRGALNRADAALAEIDERLPFLGSSSLAEAGDAWAALGKTRRATELVVRAAEAARGEGRNEAAAELGRRALALDPQARGAHRVVALALLAIEDPDAAHAHLERWHAQADDAESLLWLVEGGVAAGRAAEEVEGRLRQLAQRLGIEADSALPVAGLRAAVESFLARSGEPLADRRLAPFWEAAALCAASEEAAGDATSPGPADERPHVFLAEEAHCSELPVSRILADAQVEVLTKPPNLDVLAALRALSVAPDLLLLPVVASQPDTLETLRLLRASTAFGSIPILGLTAFEGSGLDLDQLRQLGVVGLVDRSSIPEHLAFRVHALVRADLASQRRHARAPVFVPAELEVQGVSSSEYVLNLSSGGLLVTSSKPLALNTEVRLRFRLVGEGSEVAVGGRVMNVKPGLSAGPYQIGVLFDALAPDLAAALGREVKRVLHNA